MTKFVRLRLVIAAVLIVSPAPWLVAAELKAPTIAGFERYQHAAEAAIEVDVSSTDHFLRVFRGDADDREKVGRQLQSGEVAVTRLRVTEHGKRIDVPDGLIHHWVGTVFIPGIHLDAAVALLQDYNHHAEIFRPNISRSKLIDRDGDRFRVFLRFYMKKIIAVTVDNESTAVFTVRGPDRLSSTIRSDRVAEVADAGTPQEREKAVGRGGGYMWRMNTYWRYLERDGGTYIECEALTLSRGIPTGLGWLIGPIVSTLPRDMLTSALGATRRTLLAQNQS
jgi:hypothetical protein